MSLTMRMTESRWRIFDSGVVGQLSEHAEGVLGWMLHVREAAKGVNDELED